MGCKRLCTVLRHASHTQRPQCRAQAAGLRSVQQPCMGPQQLCCEQLLQVCRLGAGERGPPAGARPALHTTSECYRQEQRPRAREGAGTQIQPRCFHALLQRTS